MVLNCGGAMGIRTPDLLHAIQRQPVHRSPSAQVTVPASTQQSTGIQTRCGTSLLYGPMPPPRCSSAESRSGQRREILCCHAPDFTHLPNRGRFSSANLCVGRYCTSGCGELVLSIATRIQARLPNRAQGVDPVLRSVGCRYARSVARGRLKPVSRKGSTYGHQPVAVKLARAQVVLPIPGMSSVMHLEENMSAAGRAVPADERADVAALAAGWVALPAPSEFTCLWLARFQGGPERAVVRVREVSLGLRCGWRQRLHLLGEVVEERPERGAERGGESALGKVRPVPLHDRR